VDSKHSLSAVSLRKRHLGKLGDPVGIATFTCMSKRPHTGQFKCESVFSLKGGELLGPVKVDYAAQSLTGRISRGIGAYKGATGTVRGTITREDHAIITVRYTD
ncbi:MAG: hypothetical protein JO214_19290, partial [Frankiaceae bacterium]|nr:hypothetical protein [Frankiaceae bacterium]